MNKRLLSTVSIVSVMCHMLTVATTSELPSPLSHQRGTIHYPIVGFERGDSWSLDAWGIGYCRKACAAYLCKQCNWQGATTNTTDLAALFFGKSNFLGEEAFANGTLLEPSNAPALSFTKISPRFDYNECGVFVGLHAEKEICDSCWHIGWRASLPIKRISVEQRRSCGTEQADDGLADVIVRRQEFTNAEAFGNGPQTNNVNGYRLDFLSALQFIDGTPLIKYGNGASDTTIGTIPVTLFSQRGSIDIEAAIGPMSVLRANDGKITSAIDITSPAEVYNLGRNEGPAPVGDDTSLYVPYILNSDGTNGNNGERRYFSRTVDYTSGLAHNRAEQAKWFLVPNSQGASNPQTIFPDANTVQNIIEYIVGRLNAGDSSALAFFRKHGVDLCLSDCSTGVGDLYAEWFGGYRRPTWYLDMLVASILPTGKVNDNARRIYSQPAGNNGHFEFRGGLEGGWHRSWFAVRGFASYTHVFDHTQMRAPAFQGATIKNIPVGRAVPARVHWGYFWGNLDVTLFHPTCCDCGVTFGYELYAKQKDSVCFCNSTAKDFFGFTHRLDDKILEGNTNTRLHKIRGEFFHHIGCCEYFVGGYYGIAGRSAMKETELHFGVSIYF